MVKISTQAIIRFTKINTLGFNRIRNQYPVKMHSYISILLKLKPFDREKNTSKYQIN